MLLSNIFERTKPFFKVVYDRFTMENKKKAPSAQSSIYEWVEELVFAIVIVVLIFSFIFRVVTVNGSSMLPIYEQDDRLIVSSLSGDPDQGDVVVILGVLNKPIIKRVIATEGQTVDIDTQEGVVYVDGQAVDETKFGIENNITKETYTSLELTPLPQEVPDGCVFVLGDNRSVSEDSRYADVGMVDTRKILGKAVFGLFPLSKFGPIG